jgi:hypothetical protein
VGDKTKEVGRGILSTEEDAFGCSMEAAPWRAMWQQGDLSRACALWSREEVLALWAKKGRN